MLHLSDKASILAKETQHQTTNYPFLPKNNSSHNYLFLPRHRMFENHVTKDLTQHENHLLEQERPKVLPDPVL